MAPRVVDTLEVVNVDHEHGKRRFGANPTPPFLFEPEIVPADDSPILYDIELENDLNGAVSTVGQLLAESERQRAGALLLTSEVRIEVEGERKPACVAETLGMYFFGDSA